jgi:hypothetical protein
MRMRYVTSGPNEYLVLGRGGRIENRGTAASVFVWPGSTYVRVPATKQEARFDMTQETRDGIPLRFKGIVIYHVVDPVASATTFDFAGPGTEAINTLIAHICLGELRATAAHLTMAECIEQRKTTLSDAVHSALAGVVKRNGSWGIDLDVVQIAQVFIVDDEIRRRLEAGVRNELASRSARSEIQMKEEINRAQQSSDRRVQEESLETERRRAEFEREKLRLEIKKKEEINLAQQSSDRRVQEETLETERRRAEFEREKLRFARELQTAQIEEDAPVRLLKIEREREITEQEIALRRLDNEAKALQAEGEALMERIRQQLRREMLALEQTPVIAESLAKAFQGAQLSVYGADAEVLAPLSMLRDLLTTRMHTSGSNRDRGSSS